MYALRALVKVGSAWGLGAGRSDRSGKGDKGGDGEVFALRHEPLVSRS